MSAITLKILNLFSELFVWVWTLGQSSQLIRPNIREVELNQFSSFALDSVGINAPTTCFQINIQQLTDLLAFRNGDQRRILGRISWED